MIKDSDVRGLEDIVGARWVATDPCIIDTFAGNGGLIVDSSMGLPDEAKPENVQALIETVFTYGAG